MTKRRLDGKFIQPKDLTPDVYEGFSIVQNIVLASSNHLRAFLGLREAETIRGPIPKFVTRKNPSLDNYFADLLLRTCCEPVDYLPAYEEHVIRGSQEELPSDLNPRLVDAVLIGIGGMSTNPDFRKVYDEHEEHGTRSAGSASEVVFQEHLSPYEDRPGIKSIEPIKEEINYIDAHGRAAYDHIFTITKNLHAAQFRQPGFVAETLEPQWKRAITEAVLMSVCVSVKAFEQYDNQKAIEALKQEWNRYLEKSERLAESGYLLDRIEPEAFEHVESMIHKPGEFEISGKNLPGRPSHFTFRRILFALQRVWDPLIVSFVMGFLFEATLQAQQSFLTMAKKQIPMRHLFGKYYFIYHQIEPLEKFPHRGILFRMNDEKKRTIVVVYDPVRQITAIFRNNYLFKNIWKKFYNLLIETEGERVWYTPTDEKGRIADFILNGTESFVGIPMTTLKEDDFFELFKTAIRSTKTGS